MLLYTVVEFEILDVPLVDLSRLVANMSFYKSGNINVFFQSGLSGGEKARRLTVPRAGGNVLLRHFANASGARRRERVVTIAAVALAPLVVKVCALRVRVAHPGRDVASVASRPISAPWREQGIVHAFGLAPVVQTFALVANATRFVRLAIDSATLALVAVPVGANDIRVRLLRTDRLRHLLHHFFFFLFFFLAHFQNFQLLVDRDKIHLHIRPIPRHVRFLSPADACRTRCAVRVAPVASKAPTITRCSTGHELT